MKKRMCGAEEAYLIARELSQADAEHPNVVLCRWSTFRDALASVQNPSKYNLKGSWKNTLGGFVRALLHGGLIVKKARGLYQFTWHGLVLDSSTFTGWYRAAGRCRMDYVALAHLTQEERTRFYENRDRKRAS